jgi:hypothetical protein
MLALIRLCGWLLFTAAMSFVFLVLLDYGPGRFPDGLRQESERVYGAVRRRAEAVRRQVQERVGDQERPGRTQAR